jgi:hypothetical protein
MENINYGNTWFTRTNMLPDAGEDLTVNWGRAVVHNLANGYGMIGTIEIADTRDTVWIDLGLQKKFNFPPRVFFLYDENRNGTLLSCMDSNWQQNPVYCYMHGDLLGFRCPMWSSQRPAGTVAGLYGSEPNGTWIRTDVYRIYFRVHGV